MLRFVLRRLLQVVPTLLLLSVLVFAWLRSLPSRAVAELNRVYGLDQPLPVQFLRFLGRAVTGDFGNSSITNQPVLTEIARAFPATVELSIAALLIAVVLGIPLGYVSARRRGRPLDVTVVIGTLVGVAVPVFFLGYLLKLVFAVDLGWFPPSGRQSIDVDATPVTGFAVLDGILTREWDASLDALSHLVLPAVTLASIPLAVIVRITRASVLDVIDSDFVRTANAKGLTAGTVRTRYVLRNALLPVSTTIGLQTGLLLGGAILTERVFVWGGIGSLLAQGIEQRDYPRLQALLLLGAFVYILVNLLVDLSYAVIDPRVRL
jgi:peptide/nickel transport system permease protein